MIHLFTSAAPNYLGKVRALCESLREHIPGAAIHWLVADDVDRSFAEELPREPFDDILLIRELEGGADRGWLFQHTLVELATALKPAAALELLSRDDCELVLYFDPDIVLFSELHDLLQELRRSSLVLTPHQLQPESEEGALFHELDSLRYGIFNLGFLGLNRTSEARRFLGWWRDRCRMGCIGDWRAGVFTDQKWVDFAPVFFDGVGILRSPRFNVAPWNLSQRALKGSFDEGFTVNGEPLGFYHFSGFDSGAHEEHLRSLGRESPAVGMLVDWYRFRTGELTGGALAPWRLGSYEDGTPIETIHRTAYRRRPDLRRAFPDPYLRSGGGGYLEWFQRSARREMPELFREPADATAGPGGGRQAALREQ